MIHSNLPHTLPKTYPHLLPSPNPPTHAHTYLTLSTSHEGHVSRDDGDAGDVAFQVRLGPQLRDVEHTLDSIQPPTHTPTNTYPPPPTPSSSSPTHAHTYLRLSTSHEGHLPRDGGDAGDVALHVRLGPELRDVEDTAAVEDVLSVQRTGQVLLGHAEGVERLAHHGGLALSGHVLQTPDVLVASHSDHGRFSLGHLHAW